MVFPIYQLAMIVINLALVIVATNKKIKQQQKKNLDELINQEENSLCFLPTFVSRISLLFLNSSRSAQIFQGTVKKMRQEKYKKKREIKDWSFILLESLFHYFTLLD